MRKIGIQMDATERERECFARAVSTATDALYLSCAATDEKGKPGVTSFFVEDLQRAGDWTERRPPL